MREFIEKLSKNGLLKIIDEPCDVNLEIAHLSYAEVKKAGSKALLFKNPVDKTGKKFPPVLTNTFGSFKALNLIFGREPDAIAKEIEKLLKPEKPETLRAKFDFFTQILSLKNIIPKKLKSRGACQEIVESEPNLFDLPALKTWENDGGRFITMGQVYTQDLSGKHQNLGMYRLQIHSKNELGMHWQIHKDAAHFYHEYAAANRPMPVSIAIGGDPLYIWCGQAPLPKNIFELLLFGFIRKTPARLVKSLTNDIFIPHDADFVIEGFVNPGELRDEGKFGDHTGFYTPIEPFPVMKVSAITHKKAPIFHATVVGKPPLEDKFMGLATERIFLPLLRTSVPDLIDYKMPENGVFHNLILAKFRCAYPAHAQQIAHAFWGVGQMSFVKHAIFVGENAPNLSEFKALSKWILDRLSPEKLLITSGLCDQLDHASPNSCYGGKLGIDASGEIVERDLKRVSDAELFFKFSSKIPEIKGVKQYFTDAKNPLCLVKFEKNVKFGKEIWSELLEFKEHFSVVILLDSSANLDNPYMLVWRVSNNIDALRDLWINGEKICLDATSKSGAEGYPRQWPQPTNCTKSVIERLIKKGLLSENPAKNCDFFTKFEFF